jgi:hypothetical protein
MLDYAEPKTGLQALLAAEGRFQLTEKHDPERYQNLMRQMEQQIRHRWTLHQELTHLRQ